MNLPDAIVEIIRRRPHSDTAMIVRRGAGNYLVTDNPTKLDRKVIDRRALQDLMWDHDYPPTAVDDLRAVAEIADLVCRD